MADESAKVEEGSGRRDATGERGWVRYGVLGLLFLLNLAYLVVSLVLTPEDPLLRILICGAVGAKLILELLPAGLVRLSMPRKKLASLGRMRGVRKVKVGVEGLVLACLLLMAVFVFPETELATRLQRCQSILGLAVFVGGLALTSRSFWRIPWRLVVPGILMQVLVGLFVMRTLIGKQLFRFLSDQCVSLLSFAMRGSGFVFGDLATANAFAFIVLPVILFFSSLMQILYYLGAMQWVIGKFAVFFRVTMGVSGCEATAAAAVPFTGMVESTLTVKPFLAVMTQSELHQILTSGMSTIAASVLLAFVKMGIDNEALLTSCAMAIPCSLAISKLRYPETEESRIRGQVAPERERESNLIHAAANGAAQGVTICLMVAGTLLAVISLLHLVDATLAFFGAFVRVPNLSLSLVGGYVFIPFAWLVGVPWRECQAVGQLMAVRIITNEFVAFTQLAELQAKHALSARAALLATYALCGFANFTSVGIQLSCIGGMAPARKADVAKLAVSAVLTGTMCTFVSAAIAGILI